MGFVDVVPIVRWFLESCLVLGGCKLDVLFLLLAFGLELGQVGGVRGLLLVYGLACGQR